MVDLTEQEKHMVDEIVAKVDAAQKKYATYTQEQVDHIFKSAAIAAAAEK